MRTSLFRQTGILGLIFLISFWLGACSGQQQDEEQLEVTQQGEQQGNEEAGDEYAQQGEEGQDQGYDQQGEESNGYAEEGGEEGNEYAEQQGNGEYAQQGEETENDLQEIIEQMNGQEGEQYAVEGGEEALQQDAPAEMAPMEEAPMADAAPMGDAGMQQTAEAAPAASSAPFQPGGTPAGPALPEMGSKMPYVVQKGDTLARISARVYGDMNRWQEMASLSGLANPSRIYPGDLVYYTLDEQSVAFASAYESVSRSEEQVQPGDTLATISQRVYGSSSNWKAIWRQNDGIDNPDVIPPGSTVYYISQGALSAEIKKVKAELQNIADIRAKSIRMNGIAKNTALKANTDA